MKTLPLLPLLARAAALALALLPLAALAQPGGVGIGTAAPDASAALDVVSSTKGVLLPRVDSVTRVGIANPATGLLAFQTDGRAGFFYYGGSGWLFLPDKTRGGDNLGNHTATQALRLQGNALTGTGASVGAAVGLGVRADGGLNLGQNTAGNNVYLGYQSGGSTTTGAGNLFAGYRAGEANTTGSQNQFDGHTSGLRNTTGSDNQFSGYQSGAYNTTGSRNHFSGYQAGTGNSTGGFNQFVGYQSGQGNTTGSYNLFVGYQSGLANTSGDNNQFVGVGSGAANTTGSFNQFGGLHSGASNTTGVYNQFEGYQSGFANTTGNGNVFGGWGSGFANTTGSGNVCVGMSSGLANTSGSGNTLVGINADVAAGNLTNATALGNGAVASASDKVRLGNTTVTVIEGQVAYSIVSDARFKYQVRANVPGLAFITKLRPVTYRFDTQKLDTFHRTGALPAGCTPDSAATVQTGFLAQDVEAAARAVGYRFDGVHAPTGARDHYSLAYSQFVMPLVRAVQEQQALIEALQAQNATLQARTAHAATDHADLQTLKQQLARLLDEAALAGHAPAQARR